MMVGSAFFLSHLQPAAQAIYLLFGAIRTTACVFCTLFLMLIGWGRKEEEEEEVEEAKGGRVSWWSGSVVHTRSEPKRHSFRYDDVRYALLNLDSPPKWFQYEDENKVDEGEIDGREEEKGRRGSKWLSASSAKEFVGLHHHEDALRHTVWLLFMPTCASFSLNPIAVYYIFESERGGAGKGGDVGSYGSLLTCIAQVTSEPWSDVVRFEFKPDGDCIEKVLHVSPFIGVENHFWRLNTRIRDDQLVLRVETLAPLTDGCPLGKTRKTRRGSAGSGEESFPLLTAVLSLKREEEGEGRAKDSTFSWESLKRCWQPQKAALRIYWNALLLFLKGVPLHGHPPLHSIRAIGRQIREANHRQIMHRKAPPWPWSTGSAGEASEE